MGARKNWQLIHVKNDRSLRTIRHKNIKTLLERTLKTNWTFAFQARWGPKQRLISLHWKVLGAQERTGVPQNVIPETMVMGFHGYRIEIVTMVTDSQSQRHTYTKTHLSFYLFNIIIPSYCSFLYNLCLHDMFCINPVIEKGCCQNFQLSLSC